MNPVRWDALLALANVQRGRLSQIAERVHPYTLPRIEATPEQLDAAEARIGQPLDPLYRELLCYGNGWPLLIWDADMLGTDDLGQGPRWAHGHALLEPLLRQRRHQRAARPPQGAPHPGLSARQRRHGATRTGPPPAAATR